MHRYAVPTILLILLVTLFTACAPAAQPAGNAASTPAATAVPATAAPATAGTATAALATAAPAAGNPTAAADTPAAVVPNTAGNAPAGTRTFNIVPEQSSASYEVQEKFLNRDLPNQAIGKTSTIQGQLLLNTTGKPTASIPKMTVDLSTLTSDESRRDNMIKRNWLQSSQYPMATFVSTGIQGAPDSYTEGQEISFKLLGNLTIHDTTKPTTWDVKAKLAGDTLTGTATTNLLMKDFGFNPPDIANMLTVTDGVKVTVNFTAKEQK